MGRDRTGGTGTPPASHPGEGLRHVWTRRRPRPLTHHATPPTRRPPPLEPTHHAPQPQTTPPKPARHAPGSLKTPPHSGPAPPHLGVAAEAGALPRPHGPQRRFPHRQLELLAGDQLHGLPPRPAVIQRRLLIPAPQRPVVESGLRGRSRPRRHHSDRGCGCGGRTTWRMRASLVSPSPPPRQPSPPPSPGGGGASLTLVPSRKSGSGPVPSRSTSLYTPSARSCSTCCAIVAPPLPAPPRLSSAASAAVRLFPERRRPRGGAPYRRGVALGAGAGTTGQWAGPGPPVAGNGSRPAPTPPHPPLRSGYRGERGDSGIKAGPEARPRPWKGRGVWWGTPPVKVTSRSGGTHAEAASSPTLCQSRQGHEGQAAVAGPRYAIPDAAGIRGRPDTPSRGETGGTFAGGGFPVPHGGRWHVAVPPALPAGVPPRGDGGSHQRPSSPRACGPSATCSSWLPPRRPPAGRWALAPPPRFGAVIALMAVLPGLVQLQPFNANPLAASPPPPLRLSGQAVAIGTDGASVAQPRLRPHTQPRPPGISSLPPPVPVGLCWCSVLA